MNNKQLPLHETGVHGITVDYISIDPRCCNMKDKKELHKNKMKKKNDLLKNANTTCSSSNILHHASRTSSEIIQSLAWWYQYFLPSELNFLFYLYRRWSIYDPVRNLNIANAFRDNFGTTHTNGIIQSLLAYFRSHPEVQLFQRTIIDDDIGLRDNIIHLIPFTDICTLCEKKLSVNSSRSRQIKVICDRGKILNGTVFWLECRHLDEHKKSPSYFYYPNFVRIGDEHIYSLSSLYNGKFIYFAGDYGFARSVLSTYSCNIVTNACSWWKTADSYNLQAFNEGLEQTISLCWKRLAQCLLMYNILQFHLTMGCHKVAIPMLLRDFDDWTWTNYPKMLSWFIYLWSSHKNIIGACNSTCSAAVIIDGHQKCRRRVCKYKDVRVETDEFEKLVIGCCRSPIPQSHYCLLHHDQQQTEEISSTVSKSYKMILRRRKLMNHGNRRKRWKENFGATGCRTNKEKSDAYIRRCSRSFGLIACVTNCRVFISFGEIFRSETLREILHLLFSTIRVAGKLPPAGCYDDGCHLVKYLHNHIGKDLKATDAARILFDVKFSVDRTHFKNHVGKWCLTNMNPADNRRVRYAVTQWEGHQDEIVVQFKRMRLSDDPENDERLLEAQIIIEQLINKVCVEENTYDIDDYELAALSEIFEREYYGYLTDTELVLAMNKLTVDINNYENNQQSNNIDAFPTNRSPTNLSNDNLQHDDDDADVYF
ncbi:unnamed protein product [Rotaria socialis]|uniref:Uncharacterized protein n=1 Tax=Rotaria socialis TaxID=392032 RepID=A0A818N8L0_9BILA|nr:unnamed protein product [Rotaria socialis]